MSHKCPQCGQIAFRTYHEYEVHRFEFHGVKSKLRPEKITGRTAKQIIKDAEDTWLLPHLILTEPKEIVLTTGNEDIHLDACICKQCINRRLDAIIEASEKSLEMMQQSVILEHDKE